MPEVHGGLQARVRREERRFGYGKRCRTRFRARADGCAATNPWIELPGHHQDRHPDRRAGSRGQYRARSPELGGGDRLLHSFVERHEPRVGLGHQCGTEADFP